MNKKHPDPNTGQRQNINFVYRNADEEIALEWVTSDPNQPAAAATALTLFEIGFAHISDIPASIANFRQVTK